MSRNIPFPVAVISILGWVISSAGSVGQADDELKKSGSVALEKTAPAANTGAVRSGVDPAHRQLLEQMETIAQAMHDCQRQLGRYPGADYALYKGSKKSGLNWRVLLLPFLGEEDMYSEFHWDEPWDSEHNKPFLDRMPAVFQVPGTAAGRTRLHVFTGEKTPQGAKPRTDNGPTPSYFPPTTTMFVLGGTETATEWTRPGGIPFNPDDPLSKLGSPTDGGYPVALFDGAIRLLPAQTRPEDVRKVVVSERGELIPPDKTPLQEWRP